MSRDRKRSRGQKSGSEPPRAVGSDDGDIAAIVNSIKLPQDLTAASLRSCAARCRDFAARQPDPRRAELFRTVAASFEQQASLKESRPAAGGI